MMAPITAKPMQTDISAPDTDFLEGFADSALLVDGDYRILATNSTYRRMFGNPARFLGRTCHLVSHGSDVPCDQLGETCPLQASRTSGEAQQVLHIHRTGRGEERIEVEVRPIFADSGELRYFVEIMRPARTAGVRPGEGGMVGRSPAFNRMLTLMDRVAPAETATLLLGETGTGKEMVAQAIHANSPWAKGLFVPVECSGLTESLFETELFGHEKGAFTSAHTAKIGLVETAQGGTLFLDEIGDIPLQLQVKLLRLLETRTYRRVGGTEPRQADFRLICATHRNLRQMVAEGRFRQDLFYRINTFPIHLPPLRERKEDIPLLAQTLLQRLPRGQEKRLDPEALHCLQDYAFPGNVRELRNILERACLMTDDATISLSHLPDACLPPLPIPVTEALQQGEILPLDLVERHYLTHILSQHGDLDRRLLSARLGISERTLFRKIRSLREHEDATPS